MQDELIALEERFWKGDVGFYDARLAANAIMVFADPVGVLDRAATLQSLEGSPRWTDVAFDDVRTVALGEAAVLVTYRARARREGGASYGARASSAYIREGSGWLLAFHQQTPEPIRSA